MIDNISTETVKDIIVTNAASLTLQNSSTASVLTVSDHVNIGSGASLTLGTNCNLSIASSASANVNGTLNTNNAFTVNTSKTDPLSPAQCDPLKILFQNGVN